MDRPPGLNSPALKNQRFNESLGEAIPVTHYFRSIGACLAPDDPPHFHQKVNLPSHSHYAKVQSDSAISCVESN